MDNYLWRCLDSSNTLHINRHHIELAIQKKKINDVFNWFTEHFVSATHAEYVKRCPILILQGPTGCGKTITLRLISRELKIPIKEYSETTDLTAINFDLSKSLNNDSIYGGSCDDDNQRNSSQTIDRRRALKFEHFVINNLRYSTLYPATERISPLVTGSFNNSNSNSSIPFVDSDAEAEFDTEDELFFNCALTAPNKIQKPPPVTGVIIHIETPLGFARCQRILIQTLHRLTKIIKELSRNPLRRIAIVFETLEADAETITLPTKIKQSLGIQTFKFNPVTKANMKKLIEFIVKQNSNIVIDKDTIEQVTNDSDGDIRACLNTLQLICNKSNVSNDNLAVPMGILNQQNKPNNNYNYHNNSIDKYSSFIQKTSPYHYQQNQATKKIKLVHIDNKDSKSIRLTPNLLRDNTRSLSFFHLLGKIFYQKRLYPDYPPNYQRHLTNNSVIREFDRPYPLADSTEEIANMLDTEAKNLLTWLHQHYHKFCHDNNIDKAALFLENQSVVDITSLNSTQSTQFYEMHSSLDKLQLHLAINSTIFSLYEDQSNAAPKSSHKKKITQTGIKWIKSSVESSSTSGKVEEFYSFKKPAVKSLDKVVDDYYKILDICASRLFDLNLLRVDSTKLIVDYIPYLNHMCDNWSKMPTYNREEFKSNTSANCAIFDDEELLKLYKTLDKLDTNVELDYDSRHDNLIELIDELEKHGTQSTTN